MSWIKSALTMVEVIAVLNVLKTFGEVISSQISTCDNGLGILTYERLPGFQMKPGYAPDELIKTAVPADVLEQCRLACLQDVRVKNGLLHRCNSFDYRPGETLDSGGYRPSSCRLSDKEATLDGTEMLQSSATHWHFNEICLPYEHITENCPNRYFVFDRYPGKAMQPSTMSGCVRVPSNSAEHCQRICLSSQVPVCLSATYHTANSTCLICDSTSASHAEPLQDSENAVYMENLCLKRSLSCDTVGQVVFVEQERTGGTHDVKHSYLDSISVSGWGGRVPMERLTDVTLDQCKSKCADSQKLQCSQIEFVPLKNNGSVGDCYPMEQRADGERPRQSIGFHAAISILMERHCLNNKSISTVQNGIVNRITDSSADFADTYLRREGLQRESSGSRYVTAFRRYSRQKVQDIQPLTATDNVSVQTCLMSCLLNDRCAFVNHNRKRGLCHLLPESHSVEPLNLVYDKDFDHYENLIYVSGNTGEPHEISTPYRDLTQYENKARIEQNEKTNLSLRGSFSGGNNIQSPPLYIDKVIFKEDQAASVIDYGTDRVTSSSSDLSNLNTEAPTIEIGRSIEVVENPVSVGVALEPLQVDEDGSSTDFLYKQRDHHTYSFKSANTQSSWKNFPKHSRQDQGLIPYQPIQDDQGFVSLASIARRQNSGENNDGQFVNKYARQSRVLDRSPYTSFSNNGGDANKFVSLNRDYNANHRDIPVIRKMAGGSLVGQQSQTFGSFGSSRARTAAVSGATQELDGQRSRALDLDVLADDYRLTLESQLGGAKFVESVTTKSAADETMEHRMESGENTSDLASLDTHPASAANFQHDNHPALENELSVDRKHSRMFGSNYVSRDTSAANSTCYSDKFTLKATGRRLKPSLVTEIVSVSSLSQCEEACVRSVQYTCTALSYRYSSVSESRASLNNCELSDTDHVTSRPEDSAVLQDNRDLDYYERIVDQQCELLRLRSQSSLQPVQHSDSRSFSDHNDLSLSQTVSQRRTVQNQLIETALSSQEQSGFADKRTSVQQQERVSAQAGAKFLGSVNVIHEEMLNTDGGEVTADCDERGMLLKLTANAPFYGRIYTNGHYDTCSVVGRGERVLTLQIAAAGSRQECGTRQMGDSMNNIVVVQFSEYVQTSFDKRYNLTCYIHGPGETVVSSGYISASPGQMTPVIDLPTRELLDSRVRLSILYDGQPTSTIAVGDPLLFRLETQSGANLLSDVFAYNVIARDPYSGKSVQLIDQHGCPTDARLFPALHTLRDGNGLQARFNAFKIPQSNYLLFEATVRACRQACPPTQCTVNGAKEMSFGRRKRRNILSQEFNETQRANNSIEEDYSDNNIRKLISVYYTRSEIEQNRQQAGGLALPHSSTAICVSASNYRTLIALLATLGVGIFGAVATIAVKFAAQRQREAQLGPPSESSIGSQWTLSGWRSSFGEHFPGEGANFSPCGPKTAGC